MREFLWTLRLVAGLMVLTLVCFVGIPAGLMACGRLLARPEAPSEATARPPCKPCPPCDSETAEVMVERDRCQAELAEDPKVEIRRRTVEVPVQVEGPPKACGGKAPVIERVDPVDCQPGMVCLDTKAQLALATNLARYEAWIERVRACEGAP